MATMINQDSVKTIVIFVYSATSEKQIGFIVSLYQLTLTLSF